MVFCRRLFELLASFEDSGLTKDKRMGVPFLNNTKLICQHGTLTAVTYTYKENVQRSNRPQTLSELIVLFSFCKCYNVTNCVQPLLFAQ